MGRQDAIVELYYGGAWHAAPAYVRDPITITRGYRNEGGGFPASTASLTLDNRSGDYNPRNATSPLYGLIGRNTPIRVGLGLAADTFGGTSASGWTPTDSGQPWSGIGAAAADFTESAGLGRHLQPLKNIVRISLLAEDRYDVEQVTEVSIPAVALGASAVVGHVARQQAGGDYYWLRMELDVGGAVTAKISRTVSGSFTELAVLSGIPGLTYTAGQSYSLRSSVCGSLLSLRVWPTGTAEPSGWTLTAFDASITAAGRYGLASWVVAGNTNTTEVRFDNYQAVDRRCVLEIASWKPGRTLDFNRTTGKGDAWMEIEAAGILRRLGQGNAPSRSAMRRTIAASGTLAYWPAEDGHAAEQAGSAVAGHPPLRIDGPVKFATIESWSDSKAYTVAYGTSALVDLSGGPSLTATVPADVTAATSGAAGWTAHAAAGVETSNLSGDLVLLEVHTPGGTYTKWQLVMATAVRTRVIASNGSTSVTVAEWVGGFFGAPLHPHNFAVWESSPGTITAAYGWDSLSGWKAAGTTAGTLGGVSQVVVNPTRVTATAPFAAGHVALWPGHELDVVDIRDGALVLSMFGYQFTNIVSSADDTGEPATERLVRLCAEEGIPLQMPPVSAEAVICMGWQPVATLTTLLTQCVDVDMGFLYEPRDSLGLAYRPRESLYNQAPKLTVDFAAGEVKPPFDPVIDDMDVRNDITVKRTGGSSARAIQTTGPLAAIPAEDGGVGVYATEVELNLADDSRLADIAGWMLHKGTTAELSHVLLRRLAYHEAGHAVAAVVLGAEVAWADMEADGPGSAAVLVRKVDPQTDAVVMLAGYEAGGGRLFCPPSTHDTRAAVASVGEAGIPAARQAARQLLAANRPALAAVTAALVEHGRLSGEQVVALVRGAQ